MPHSREVAYKAHRNVESTHHMISFEGWEHSARGTGFDRKQDALIEKELINWKQGWLAHFKVLLGVIFLKFLCLK